MFSSFSGVLLVAGGSGITFTLGILQDLIMKDREGRSRVNTIQVIWAIQDPCTSQFPEFCARNLSLHVHC